MNGQTRQTGGNGSYIFWWIASYIIPMGLAWPLWYVSHGLAIAVEIILTLLFCMIATGGRR